MLWKETVGVWAWGLYKVPLLGLVGPRVIELSKQRVEIKIPLNKLTKNHLGSMYFGVLAIGADGAGGLLGLAHMRDRKDKIDLVFKDFKAEFLKRPESDVHFICEDGAAVAELVEKTVATGQRQNTTLNIKALCPSQFGEEPVARMALTLSLKARR